MIVDNHISDEGVKYLITVLARSPLGVVSKIEMAGRNQCRFGLEIDNSISKQTIELCEQALSGQNSLRVLFTKPRA